MILLIFVLPWNFFLLLVILLSSVGTFYFELPILNFFFMVGRGVGWVWGVTKKLLCCSLDILCFLLGLGGIHFCCDNFHHNLHNIQTTTSLKVSVRSASYLNRTTLATSQSRSSLVSFQFFAVRLLLWFEVEKRNAKIDRKHFLWHWRFFLSQQRRLNSVFLSLKFSSVFVSWVHNRRQE